MFGESIPIDMMQLTWKNSKTKTKNLYITKA